jgi:nephrocystin-3
MGSRSSFLQREDDDVLGTEYDSSQGVVKSIPNEVKPRPKIGGGVRSGRSLSKQKNGSLRSALSVDIENPEVEKIRKDFEMYRLNKENEIASLRKKEQKLETENRRLRAELQAKEKTSQKQKEERDAALEAEHRALMRAAAIESDRDKIQHLFKVPSVCVCQLWFLFIHSSFAFSSIHPSIHLFKHSSINQSFIL